VLSDSHRGRGHDFRERVPRGSRPLYQTWPQDDEDLIAKTGRPKGRGGSHGFRGGRQSAAHCHRRVQEQGLSENRKVKLWIGLEKANPLGTAPPRQGKD